MGAGAALVGGIAGAALMLGIHDANGGDGVRRYLLTHPEVVTEAIERLRDRETAKLVAPNRAAIETPVGSAWAGDPKGDVTLVEYFDYNCGYCRASLPVLAALLKADPHLRVVYRELPVLAESSHDAALASLAAAHQGKFAAFHDALYAEGPVSAASIAAAAHRTGVTLPAAPSTADEAELVANVRMARQLGMTGTPSWVVGDRVLIGAQPLDQLQAAVAAARDPSASPAG
jgi:protein-disulfide isomerase